MLNKQVKARIARNKQKRKMPMWKREMRAFLISQLPPNQSALSSKHLDVSTLYAAQVLEQIKAQQAKATDLFEKLRVWTRHDWNAFIRSGDVDYANYLGLRNLYHSVLGAREATRALLTMPFDARMVRRRELLKGLTQEQINRAYRKSSLASVTIDGKEYAVSPLTGGTLIPRDPVFPEARKHIFGTIQTFSFRDSPTLNSQELGRIERPLTTETLRVRSIDTDLTGDELITAFASWYERRYRKSVTTEEAVAEVARIGEKQANDVLRQELIRNRTRVNGDPWSELRVVTQPTADDYYNRVLHRPRVLDSKGEREMTEAEWDLWKQYQDHLKSGAVEWQPGFAPTPKKEGE